MVAQLASQGQGLDEHKTADLAWSLAIKQIDERPITPRVRAVRIMVAGFAAAYGAQLLPPPSWRLVGVEVPTDDGGRIDAVWIHPDGRVLYDEWKVTFGVPRPVAGLNTPEQVGRYLRDGIARHGRAFVGVRICTLTAPRFSQLVVRGGLLRVVDGPYWFGGPAR